MEFQGPTAEDLANVRALNRSYLALPPPADGHVAPGARLTAGQRRRLATTPFLLFSLREGDDAFWDRLFADDGQLDFINGGRTPDPAVRKLQAAGLAFLWQLVRRNAYAARAISGASPAWCERIARTTLVCLLDNTTRCTVLAPRFGADARTWQHLLARGGSARRSVRVSAQHRALQAMLTDCDAASREQLRAAACAMPGVSRRVADTRGRRGSDV